MNLRSAPAQELQNGIYHRPDVTPLRVRRLPFQVVTESISQLTSQLCLLVSFCWKSYHEKL
jgi:hypothetical protein